MATAAAPTTPFTFTDVVLHTLTTWGLFSVFAIVYRQVPTATRDDQFALAADISGPNPACPAER